MPSGATRLCGGRPSDARDLLGRPRGERRAVEHDLTRLRRDEPGEGPQQRRLAASVGADDRRDPAGGEVEAVLDHDAVAVGEGDGIGATAGVCAVVISSLSAVRRGEQVDEEGRAEGAVDDADR